MILKFRCPHSLIAGRYAVDTSQILVDAGGGLPAYLARDRMAADGKRAAIAVSRDASPRIRALTLLTEPIDSLMIPLGHGVAPLAGGKGEGYFVICAFPPGPPVSASLSPWPEKALTDLVLRPIAQVLDVLHTSQADASGYPAEQRVPSRCRTAGNAWGGLGGAARHASAGRVRVAVQRDVPSRCSWRWHDRR